MIRVENLSKYYGGTRALGPVSFEIEDGETVGFLGLNGAGKTTALRVLACDLRPSAGTVSIDGVDAVAEPHEVRKRIGFLPENPPVYGDMTVLDYLRFAGELRGMRKPDLRKRMPEVLALTDLDDVRQQVISTLSHGYRQRVGVAQAIIHNPRLLILDEPTRGLDPVQIVEMRNLVTDLKKSHTVLVSSHILTEISQTCDRLLVLGKGAILGAGTEAELSAHEGEIRQVSVAVRAPGAAEAAAPSESVTRGGGAKTVAEVLAKIDGVTAVGEPHEQGAGLLFTISCGRDVRADVSRAVVGAGWDLIKLDYSRSELENTFIRLVGGNDASN
jgi:ABC-2 type transport system ATP-binding protein